ncbi:MAG: bifunctional (p)ppGpp synthetase/guanosine-3',5'-bis(diphosphate) 3'-pyrophosphohydrolase [Eubacterium sp.]|nr:bifunctional (p)ppGpp synthetase/guanosine-3',5'-bis(diphosphate) 3'-pyrophosphohydrolase [Eubacterium sp.]
MTVEEAEVKTETAENTVNGAEQEKSEPQPISIVYDVYGRKRAGDLQTPADFTPPETLYRELIEKIKLYHPSEDFSMIEKAYKLADEAHNGQKRKSGEPYIIHPICVGIILAELEMDKETIVAGLLHDVIEDTVVTKEELAREFSEEIALLVDGVTKLTKLNLSQDKIELQAENLRKMFLAMAQDIRVIIIKLADRLHNLRTLQYQSHEKQIEKARETMDIYSPIAHRLGISKIKIELDDLSMQYLYPEVYMDLRTKIDERLTEREEFINEMVAEVRDYIKEAGIKAEIDGRVKHLFSIFKKMKTQDKTLDQIFDIFALRIKVDTVRDCYAALGIIHEKYKPIPGRFKDYIAMPKANMYQSLHTTLIGHGGRPFEIQIRTYEMHRTAEYGIAAHWKYKESGSTNVNKEEEKLNWLRKILEWQNDTADNREFMNVVKTDLDIFQDQVYCFTPDGDVKTLPAGSTPIDFAYVVHTAVGNRMVGARVNGRQVPIEYKLKSGDRVEIITSQNSRGPSMDWLNIVQSTQARTKINQWFRQEHKAENIVKGKSAVEDYCKNKGIDQSSILQVKYQEKVLKKYNFPDWDSLMAAIGHGGIKEGQVVNRLLEEINKEKEANKTDDDVLAELKRDNRHYDIPKGSIQVKGIDDVAVRFSKCCSPVPGDEIVGFVTRGRGVSIHRTDCINVLCMEEGERTRLIDAEWIDSSVNGEEKEFTTEINIYTMNRQGMLFDISKVFNEAKIDLKGVNVRINKQGKATVTMQFGIRSKEQLAWITAKLRNIEGVIDIERTRG